MRNTPVLKWAEQLVINGFKALGRVHWSADDRGGVSEGWGAGLTSRWRWRPGVCWWTGRPAWGRRSSCAPRPAIGRKRTPSPPCSGGRSGSPPPGSSRSERGPAGRSHSGQIITTAERGCVLQSSRILSEKTVPLLKICCPPWVCVHIQGPRPSKDPAYPGYMDLVLCEFGRSSVQLYSQPELLSPSNHDGTKQAIKIENRLK